MKIGLDSTQQKKELFITHESTHTQKGLSMGIIFYSNIIVLVKPKS